MKWRVHLRNKANRFDPHFHYLANIATEVRRSYVKSPQRVKPKDFLLTFKFTRPGEEEKKPNVEESKRFWLGGVGLSAKEIL